MDDLPAFGVLRVLLRAFSLLAPRGQRTRWLREWEGELAHRLRVASLPGALGLLYAALRDTRHLRFLRTPNTRGSFASDPAFRFQTEISRQDKPMFAELIQDFRFSFRALRAAPWFSLVTVLTLALGIGSSVAMYGVLHSALLEPLPFPEPHRLVMGRDHRGGHLSGADYYDYRDQSEAFQELAAIMPFPIDLTISGGGNAERVSGTVVSTNLFTALGANPATGRLFQERDGFDGEEPVVVLSYGLWQRRLGGDQGAVGRSIDLDGAPFTVIGVLPRDFFFMAPADAWIPMRPGEYAAADRNRHNWTLVGRLSPGVGLDEAQADVDVVSARLREAYPESNQDKGLFLSGLHEALTGDYRLSLWILTGAVGLVLLIACGNAAGIFLARAPARRFELSVRSAMGASRARLVRQLLGESMGLALLGGIAGTVMAQWFQSVMLEYLRMDRLGPLEPEVSLPVLAAAIGISLLSGLFAGVYPSLKSAGGRLTEGLKAGQRSGGDGGSGFRTGLVVAQVALSVVLLAGSGLLV
ncbi:MAG: ABC transporter permease, partial [Gemmatimonadota bacterium]